MIKKLKPCPFCGSNNTCIETSPLGGHYMVKCDNCWASVNFFKTKKGAIYHWNTRKEDMEKC